MDKFEIILFKNNKNISWILPYEKITTIYDYITNQNNISNINIFKKIYVKKNFTKNMIILNYIINNYNNLPEKIIFINDDVNLNFNFDFDFENFFQDYNYYENIVEYNYDFLKNNIDIILKAQKNNNKIKLDPNTFLKNKLLNLLNNNKIKLDPDIFLKNKLLLDLSNQNKINILNNLNFSINKELILKKPIEYYENIYRLSHYFTIDEQLFFEKSWHILFSSNYIQRKKIKYFFSPIITPKLINSIEKYFSKNMSEFEELHIWTSIKSNIDLNNDIYPISYIPMNNFYIKFTPKINNNQFNLKIKSKNDFHLLIDFEGNKLEIVLGAFNNQKNIIRNYNNKDILNENDIILLNKKLFINIIFNIHERITVKNDNNIIFDIENPYFNNITPLFSIKNYFGSNLFIENDFNIKYMLCENNYYDFNIFYNQYYQNYFINRLSLFELL
jgi:hypothetical protein